MSKNDQVLNTKPVPFNAQGFLHDEVAAFVVMDFDGVFNAVVEPSESISQPISGSEDLFPLDQSFMHPNRHWEQIMDQFLIHPGLVPEHDVNVLHSVEFQITYSTEMVSRFNNVMSFPDIQLIWLTTFRQDVARVTAKMGLESSREPFFLPWDGHTFASKTAALRSFLWSSNGDMLTRPVVWADDHMGQVKDPLSGVVPARFQCLLETTESTGLRISQMETMEDFIQTQCGHQVP